MLIYIKHLGRFGTLKISLFPLKRWSKIQCVSGTLPWISIFLFFKYPGAKKLDFGRPWRPIWSQMAPKVGQVAPIGSTKSIPGIAKSIPGIDIAASLLRRHSQKRSWAPFWQILDGLLMNFDGFWRQFSSMCDTFLATNLQTTKAADHETLYSQTFNS